MKNHPEKIHLVKNLKEEIIEERKQEEDDEDEGLGTGLKPTRGGLTAPHASREIETMLRDLEKTLLDETHKLSQTQRSNKTSNKTQKIQQKPMKETQTVAVPKTKQIQCKL